MVTQRQRVQIESRNAAISLLDVLKPQVTIDELADFASGDGAGGRSELACFDLRGECVLPFPHAGLAFLH
jgi:hypothetical protein